MDKLTRISSKFKEKFLNALKANQIRERDKVEVLKKHLKGYPKESIGDDWDVTSITEAFRILEQTYGNTRDTWDAAVRDFEKKCNIPDIWEKEATAEKRQLVIKIKDFLLQITSCYMLYLYSIFSIYHHLF